MLSDLGALCRVVWIFGNIQRFNPHAGAANNATHMEKRFIRAVNSAHGHRSIQLSSAIQADALRKKFELLCFSPPSSAFAWMLNSTIRLARCSAAKTAIPQSALK